MKPFKLSHLPKLNDVNSNYFTKITEHKEVQGFLDSVRSVPACLIVSGPPGVGKSHLVSWICNQIQHQHPDFKIGVGTESLCEIEKISNLDVVAIDDLDLFVANHPNGDALSEIIACCHQSKKSLILICDDHPSTIPGAGEKLISSLASVWTMHLAYPDPNAKQEIAQALARDLEMSEPIDFDLIKTLKSPREIEGFVIRTKIQNELNRQA